MARVHLSSVFFGGVEIDARHLRQYLRLGSYQLSFDHDAQQMTLTGRGGVEILRVTCARESAAKFAKDFGFKDDESATRNVWNIYVPEPVLYHDGSEAAESLHQELVASKLPFTVHKDQSELMLKIRNGRYTQSNGWAVSKMQGMIREDAQNYADVIALFNER